MWWHYIHCLTEIKCKKGIKALCFESTKFFFDVIFLSFQINGVEMALATHDQAVALLTSSRDIHLVVFRESMEVEHHEPIVSKSLCDASGLILTPWVKKLFHNLPQNRFEMDQLNIMKALLLDTQC